LWFLFDRLAASDSRSAHRFGTSLSGQLVSMIATAYLTLRTGTGLCLRPAFVPQVAYYGVGISWTTYKMRQR
jgi:hypothetical protein